MRELTAKLLQSSRKRHRGQSGLTLIEVVVVVAIVGVIMAGVATWFVTTVAAQERARADASDAATISLVNSNLLRDMSSSQFAASTSPSPPPPPASPTPIPHDLLDCPGGGLGAGEVKLVMISPGDRRIVYTLVDAVPGSGDTGKVLYRRDCSNAKGGFPATNDLTLTDPVDDLLNGPSGADSTDPTNVARIADGITSVDTSCPLDGASSATQDVNCKTVKLTMKVGAGTDRVVLQATRRTDTYCAPGCPPVARFTFTPTDPHKGDPIQFDASTSTDPRGGYIPPGPPYTDPQTRLKYQWDFDTPHAVGPTTGVSHLRCIDGAHR